MDSNDLILAFRSMIEDVMIERKCSANDAAEFMNENLEIALQEFKDDKGIE